MAQIDDYRKRLDALGINVEIRATRSLDQMTTTELRSIVLNDGGPTKETRDKAMGLIEERKETPA